MIVQRGHTRWIHSILAAVFVLAAGVAYAAAFGRVGQAEAADGFSRAAYKPLDMAEVSQYDPYLFRKRWAPMPEKRGLLADFGGKRAEPFVECVLGAGVWHATFIADGAALAAKELYVDTEPSAWAQDPPAVKPEPKTPDAPGVDNRVLVSVPPEAAGYDAVAFTQTAGRAAWLSYIKPLAAAEDAVVFNPIPPMPSGKLRNPSQRDITGAIGYFVSDDGQYLTLQAQSVSELDVLLVGVADEQGNRVAAFPENSVLETVNTSARWLTTFTAERTGLPYALSRLQLEYRYLEDGRADGAELKTSAINPFKPFDDAVFYGTEIRTQDNLDTFDFVRQEGDTVTLAGTYIRLDRMMFVPKGKQLVLQAGQTVDLSNGATIFCRDRVMVNGTKDAPVRLVSTDGTGDGLVVLQANGGLGRSAVNYLVCDGLDEVHSGIYALTGCVTFYESDVDFFGCEFLNNKSEDGLNVVRSDMTARYCRWYNTFQDAFDSDFCTGLFENCAFELTGNDALDVSTSVYTVRDCTFKDIHDKCLSVGENSTATIEDITADTAQALIGAKDLSTVYAKNLVGKDIFIGYLAYQKKPEFGHSVGRLENMRLTGKNHFDYLIEGNEIYYLDGKLKTPRGKQKEAIIIEKIINEEPITL